MKILHVIALMSGLVLTSARGQLVPVPSQPYEHLRWKMRASEALAAILKDPLPVLSRNEETGELRINRGYFFYERSEVLFDLIVRCGYAFTLKDSLLGFLILSYIEADQIPGSSKGGRDSLWARISRRYGPPDKESKEAPATQRQWQRGETTIICTKVDALARTLVLSLSPRKKD